MDAIARIDSCQVREIAVILFEVLGQVLRNAVFPDANAIAARLEVELFGGLACRKEGDTVLNTQLNIALRAAGFDKPK